MSNLSADPAIIHNTRRVTEHGQDWLTCLDCGAQWSIVDSNFGEDYEQVTEGDGYCEESAR